MNWAVFFGVAMGVGLGLTLFTALFVLVVWTFDKLSTIRKDRDDQTQQRLEYEEARREARMLRSTSEARARTIRALRAELAQLKPKAKAEPKPKTVPRPRSSWERIGDE